MRQEIALEMALELLDTDPALARGYIETALDETRNRLGGGSEGHTNGAGLSACRMPPCGGLAGDISDLRGCDLSAGVPPEDPEEGLVLQ